MNASERAELRDRIARERIAREQRATAAVNARWDDYRERLANSDIPLTPKQARVASLWANGYTLKEIAAMRGTSAHSAVFHSLTCARRKLGLPIGRTARHRRELRAALAAKGLLEEVA